jgi:hypothetical protein
LISINGRLTPGLLPAAAVASSLLGFIAPPAVAAPWRSYFVNLGLVGAAGASAVG